MKQLSDDLHEEVKVVCPEHVGALLSSQGENCGVSACLPPTTQLSAGVEFFSRKLVFWLEENAGAVEYGV